MVLSWWALSLAVLMHHFVVGKTSEQREGLCKLWKSLCFGCDFWKFHQSNFPMPTCYRDLLGMKSIRFNPKLIDILLALRCIVLSLDAFFQKIQLDSRYLQVNNYI